MIDSHHHFWTYNRTDFSWISDDMSILQRDFLPENLQNALDSTGVEGAITVQARTNLEETHWLLALASKSPLIKGVVGWVPLKDPDVGQMLDQLSLNPRFRGVREIIQGCPDDQFFNSQEFNGGIRELTSRGIPFDLLIFHHQIPSSLKFVDAHPNQRFILDHVAKPEIRMELSKDWSREIRNLAERPNVFCKFSGLTTEVREPSWDVELIRPYFEAVLEAFGPDRLMFGSDWPVCLLQTDYSRWVSATKELAAGLTKSEREAFFSKTASNAYRLKTY